MLDNNIWVTFIGCLLFVVFLYFLAYELFYQIKRLRLKRWVNSAGKWKGIVDEKLIEKIKDRNNNEY
jgi:hypothetical protein